MTLVKTSSKTRYDKRELQHKYGQRDFLNAACVGQIKPFVSRGWQRQIGHRRADPRRFNWDIDNLRSGPHSIPAMKPLELSVPIPDIGPIEVFKRYRFKVQEIWDIACAIQATFLPPKETGLWSETIGDIGDSFLKEMLKQADSAACGSIFMGWALLMATVMVDGVK
jgi:hypothetical protein